MNNIIKLEIEEVINKIKKIINLRNINVYELCQILYLEENTFIDIMVNPRSNVSLYLDIIDVIENEMG